MNNEINAITTKKYRTKIVNNKINKQTLWKRNFFYIAGCGRGYGIYSMVVMHTDF